MPVDETSTPAADAVESADVEQDQNNSVDDDFEDIDASFEQTEDSDDDSSDQSDDDDDTSDDFDEEGEPEEEEAKDEDASEEDVEETEEETTTETEMTEEERIKAHNREMYERRQLAKQEREAVQKTEQQKYIEAAEDPKDQALRQLQVDAYNNRVEKHTNKLTSDYERAINDFPILRDASPEVQAEVDAAIDAFQAMNVTVDVYGNPSDVRADLYQYLQNKADSISKLRGLGARDQVKSKTKEKSKGLTPPSRAPKKPKADPLTEGFDEEAGRW